MIDQPAKVEDIPCTVTVFQSGMPWATRNAGPHDWRLFSREQQHYSEYVQQKNAPGFGTVTLTPTAWVEVWYCSRCRVTDRRVIPIEDE